MFRLLLAISIVLLSGCGGGKCVEPGMGTLSSQEVIVPVMPKGADSSRPSMYWVNSGYKISDKDKIDITVEGTINFCPLDTAAKPVRVSMYPENLFVERTGHEFTDTHINVMAGDQLTFTAHSYNLTIPACDELLDNNESIIYYGNGAIFSDSSCSRSVPTANVCSSGAASIDMENGKKYELHMKNNKGECIKLDAKASFPRVGGTLIKTPRLQFPVGYIGRMEMSPSHEIVLSSKNVVATGRIHDARTMGIDLPNTQLTDETCKLFKEGYLQTTLSNLENVKRLAMGKIGRDYQRRYEYIDSGTQNPPKTGKPSEEDKKKIEQLLSEYTEFDINCHCGFICKPEDELSKECVRSIVRVVSGKPRCSTMPIESNAKSEDERKKEREQTERKLKSISESKKPEDLAGLMGGDPLKDLGINFKVPGLPSDTPAVLDQAGLPDIYDMAQGAAAAIVDLTASSSKDKKAEEICKSSTGSCVYIPDGVKNLTNNSKVTVSNGSIRLNYQYKVAKNGRLYLFYNMPLGADNSSRGGGSQQQSSNSNKKLLGFYDIEVHRTCYASEGKHLYMYVGDVPPDKAPDDANVGSGVVKIEGALNNGKYTINGTGAGKSGYVYFGIKVDPGYEEQLKKAGEIENSYTVRMFVPKWPATFSEFFSYLQGTLLQVLYGTAMPQQNEVVEISKKVDEALNGSQAIPGQAPKMGAVQQIYNNQVVSKPLWSAVRALLTLYLMFSVLGYIIGILQITKYDLAVRIAKIAMILALVSPGSWEFFNKHCFSLFIQGIPDIISAFNGHIGGDSSFKFLDSTLGLFLESEFWLRMLSLLTAGPVGWLLFVGIIWALWAFFKAMLRAIILYLFVIVALAFLVTLAPIFITFVLFQLTKSMFDAWIKMIVNFSLQPIILFATLAFLNQIILTSIHAVTDFTACETCAVGFTIAPEYNKSIEKRDICVVPALLPIGFSNDLNIEDRIREDMARGTDVGFMGLPFSLAMVLVLILACKATEEFGRISEVLAHSISGSVAGITASAVGATQAMLGVAGLDNATQNLIRSARGMVPVGTEKLVFDTEESSQPRHEGVAHRPGFDSPGARDSDVPSGAAGNENIGDIVGGAVAAGLAGKVHGAQDILSGASCDGTGADPEDSTGRRELVFGAGDDGQHSATDGEDIVGAQGSGHDEGQDVARGGTAGPGSEMPAAHGEAEIDGSSDIVMAGGNNAVQDIYDGAIDNTVNVESGDDMVRSAQVPESAGFEDLLGSTGGDPTQAEDTYSAASSSSERHGGSNDHDNEQAAAPDVSDAAVGEEHGYDERADVNNSLGEDDYVAGSSEEAANVSGEAKTADFNSRNEGRDDAELGHSVASGGDGDSAGDSEISNVAIDAENMVSRSGDVAESETESTDAFTKEEGLDRDEYEETSRNATTAVLGEMGTDTEVEDSNAVRADSEVDNSATSSDSASTCPVREEGIAVVEEEACAASEAHEAERNDYTTREKDSGYPEGARDGAAYNEEKGQNIGDGFEEKLSKDPDNVRSGDDEKD